MKIKKSKFIRNIIISIIALIIVAFIINVAPGFKRNRFKNVTNLVIGEENVTEKLINPIYKDKDGNLYISKDDIKQFFDKTIIFDEENKMLIGTSEVSVGCMVIGEKQITINGSQIDTLSAVIYNNDIMYVPVKDIRQLYNIEVKYVENTDILIIDKLNQGMIKAEAKEETTIRYKQRGLSKKVGELQSGDIVSAFYTTSKGWRQIRTEDGLVGFVKANTLTNEYILRQDMNQRPETKQILISTSDGSKTTIDDASIVIKDLLKMTDEGILLKNTDVLNDETSNIWANLSIDNIDLSNFNKRSKIIKNIISIAIKNDIKGINIIATANNDNLERFVIELAPQLREIGIKTNIVSNEHFSFNNDTFSGIVNYIIK